MPTTQTRVAPDYFRRTLIRARRPRRPLCLPRDERGRFVKIAAWWRPRDRWGRFVSKDQIDSLAVWSSGGGVDLEPGDPPARDHFGRFLPKDPHRRQHILEAQEIMLAEGTSRREVNALRSPETYRVHRESRMNDQGWYLEAYDDAWRGGWGSGTTIFPYTQMTTGTMGTTVWINGRQVGGFNSPFASVNVTWDVTHTTPAAADRLYWGRRNVYVNPQQREEVRVAAILAEHAFVNHPDPDALLGDAFDALKREIERQIMERYNVTADLVWQNWVVQSSTSYSPSTSQWQVDLVAVHVDQTGGAWRGWSEQTRRSDAVRTVPARPRRPTAEELQRERWLTAQREIIRTNRDRAARLRKRIAARKAKELLAMCLTPEQSAELAERNCFTVVSQHGNTYEVAKGYAGNVHLVEEGDRVESLCIHGPSVLPDEDHMLAQKLMLETDEDTFRRVANITDRRHTLRRRRGPTIRSGATMADIVAGAGAVRVGR